MGVEDEATEVLGLEGGVVCYPEEGVLPLLDSQFAHLWRVQLPNHTAVQRRRGWEEGK